MKYRLSDKVSSVPPSTHVRPAAASARFFIDSSYTNIHVCVIVKEM